ncbi:MAG: hypothetical protein ACTSPI_17420 [Candidatus Heimdallarchaeaceae archaeon]
MIDKELQKIFDDIDREKALQASTTIKISSRKNTGIETLYNTSGQLSLGLKPMKGNNKDDKSTIPNE